MTIKELRQALAGYPESMPVYALRYEDGTPELSQVAHGLKRVRVGVGSISGVPSKWVELSVHQDQETYGEFAVILESGDGPPEVK